MPGATIRDWTRDADRQETAPACETWKSRKGPKTCNGQPWYMETGCSPETKQRIDADGQRLDLRHTRSHVKVAFMFERWWYGPASV